MAWRHWIGISATVAVLALHAHSAVAATDVAAELRHHLYSGNTDLAASLAKRQLSDSPADQQTRFALGTIQFLRAIEELARGLYRFGLTNTYGGYGVERAGLARLPILRLPIPHNPHPEAVTYEDLRAVLNRFVGDLGVAEATLADIDDSEVALQLNLGLIRLDLDGDGASSDAEALWRLFARVTGNRRLTEEQATTFLIDFDRSDIPWLRAYCHLLMSIAEFPLAHDWSDAFEMTFHSLFPSADLPLQRQAELEADALAELERARERAREFEPPIQGQTETDQDYAKRFRVWRRTHENRRSIQKRQTDYDSIADVIAFIHLNHWRVVEPERLRNVLEHLESMVGLSRKSWARIAAETDDRNEWIPRPGQTGAFSQLPVTEGRVAAWMAFLDEFESILKGKKLIPHWRFEQGVNVRRMFLEPTTFDLVLLIQGSAAVPYLEGGELTTERTWRQIRRVFAGEFLTYFIWFN